MWAALNKHVGGLEICSLNSNEMTTATTFIWKERGRDVERVRQSIEDLYHLKKSSFCLAKFSLVLVIGCILGRIIL